MHIQNMNNFDLAGKDMESYVNYSTQDFASDPTFFVSFKFLSKKVPKHL